MGGVGGRRRKGGNDGNLVLMLKILQKVKLNLKQPTSNVDWTKSKFKFKTTHKQGADTQDQLENLQSGGKHCTALETLGNILFDMQLSHCKGTKHCSV